MEVGSKDCKNQRLGSTGEKQGLLDTSGLLPSGAHGTCGHLYETSTRLANILHEPMPVTDQQLTLVASRGGMDSFFKGIASGRLSMLEWIPPHTHEHKQDLMNYKN